MSKHFTAVLVAAVLSAAAHAQCFDNKNDLRFATGAFSAEEDFESFTEDSSFATPLPIAIGTINAINPINFRNYVDTPPYQFTDNNGTNHASCYTNGDAPGVYIEIRLAQPASAFGCNFSAGGLFEDLELAFLAGGQVQATCLIGVQAEAFTDRFRGYLSSSSFDTVRLRSASVIAGPTGSGGSMDDIVVTYGLGTRYCSPALNNSTGLPASLTARGSPVVAENDFWLVASNLPPNQFAYFVVGAEQGMFVPPGSAGVFCVGCVTPGCTSMGRFNGLEQIIRGPTGSLTVDLGALPLSPPVAVVPGDAWNFQCWYRDVGTTNNLTDAVRVVFL